MSCAEIRAYAEGWMHYQNRLYGKPNEADAPESHGDDLPNELSPEHQDLLRRHMMQRPIPKERPPSPHG